MVRRSPETKRIAVFRTILSFILSVIIAALSVSICFSSNFLDSKNIEKHFNCYEYTEGVRSNILCFAESRYDKNGLPADELENIITFEAVKETVDNYAGHYISARVGFDEDAYLKSIEKITDAVKADIITQLEVTDQNEDLKAVDKTVKDISDYFVGEVALPGAEHIETLLNIGVPVCYAAAGVCAFFFIFILLILFFLGEKRYRSLRAISISFFTAGLFEICLAGIVLIISQIKKFDIYPIYLYNQFMEYVHSCIGVVIAAGFITIVIGIAIASLTWINKIKGKR